MSLFKRLASQSTIIFGARLCGAGLVFLVQAMMARFWGAELLGQYLVIMAVVNLVGVVMPMGFQTIATYFAAEYRARGERRQLLQFVWRAYSQVAIAGALLLVLGYPMLGLFGAGAAPILAQFVPVGLLALAAALVFVNGGLLIGLKKPFSGFFADAIFRPLLLLAGFLIGLALTAPQAGFAIMLWVAALSYLAVVLVQFGLVMVALRDVPDLLPARPREPSRWWRFALPWVLIALAGDFFFDIDLLLLSSHLSHEELAVFGVCTRIFSLMAFGVSAVYAVTLPDMFESEANADRSGFNRKVGDANLVATLLSLLLLLIVGIGGPFALLVFGPQFSAGALPLMVLGCALLVRSAMGPASLVLSIHDRPYASLPAVGLGMAALVGGNFMLVPPFGLMGAALAALLAISLWSVMLWRVALNTAGVDVSILQKFKHAELPVAAAS